MQYFSPAMFFEKNKLNQRSFAQIKWAWIDVAIAQKTKPKCLMEICFPAKEASVIISKKYNRHYSSHISEPT